MSEPAIVVISLVLMLAIFGVLGLYLLHKERMTDLEIKRLELEKELKNGKD